MALDIVSMSMVRSFPGQSDIVRFNFEVPVPTASPGQAADGTPLPSPADSIKQLLDAGDFDGAKKALKPYVPPPTAGAIDFFFSVLPKPVPPKPPAPPPPTPPK